MPETDIHGRSQTTCRYIYTRIYSHINRIRPSRIWGLGSTRTRYRMRGLIRDMYSLSNALSVPTVRCVSCLSEALVRTQRLCQVGIETTTLGQTGQEVVQLCRQATFPPVAWTCGHVQHNRSHHAGTPERHRCTGGTSAIWTTALVTQGFKGGIQPFKLLPS